MGAVRCPDCVQLLPPKRLKIGVLSHISTGAVPAVCACSHLITIT